MSFLAIELVNFAYAVLYAWMWRDPASLAFVLGRAASAMRQRP